MLVVFPYMRAINNPNEFVRVFTAMAMVEQGTFAVDDQINVFGHTNDLTRPLPKSDGKSHYYMVKAPGVVYLGVPGYFIFSKIIAPLTKHTYPTMTSSQEDRLWWLEKSTWALRLFASNIPCFLFLLWFEKYLRDFTRDGWLRYTAVAAAGLGTNYLAYTHMFASHSQYAAVAFSSFALTERERRIAPDAKERRFSRALLAGFFTSATVALEYHALFLAIILSIFGAVVWRRPTRLLGFALGGLSNVPPLMYFHWRAYGNPLTPGHQMLETQQFAIEHQTGLWGVVWPTWEHVKALAIDPGFGFFGMSPYMWIGVVGLPLLFFGRGGAPMHRKALRIATFVWAICGLLLFLVNAGIIEWRAGWTVGPRYLAACPPFFAFGAVLTLERFAGHSAPRRAIARGVGGGLALASVLAIGTVSLVFDTLPESIQRPFAQFSIPMMMTGFVPHHIGEWFGWSSTTLWYIACAALVAAPIVAGLWPSREPPPSKGLTALRIGSFVVALAVGLVPAFMPTENKTPLFVLSPDTRGFPGGWEPPGRDRISLLRAEAERYGPRRPCYWYKLAYLERLLGNEAQALRDEARAGQTPRDQCPKVMF